MEFEAWGGTLGGLELVPQPTDGETEWRVDELELDADSLRQQ